MRRASRGFTLIELLAVIGIIGVLSTLAMIAIRTAQTRARIAKAQHDVDALVLAIKQLETDTGEWPGHQDVEEVTTGGSNEIWDLNGPEAGIAATDGLFPNWNGPYMVEVKDDPWGNPYFWDSDYTVSGEARVVVGSFGPNGVGRNVYDSDDVYKLIR